MPVTARLSQAFYDRFGEQVTNELVEWFNAVDLTYRNDLRALNETNFARFEAVLEARFAQAEMRWEARLREALAAFEVRLDGKLDARLQPIEDRLSRQDDRLSRLEDRFSRLEDQLIGMRDDFHRALGQQLRWMIGLWMTTTVGILAVLMALLRQGG